MRPGLILLVLCAAGCQITELPIAKSNAPEALIGCWQSEDGLSREVWTEDPSGWFLGYALDRTPDGEVGFFEHMRLEVMEGRFDTLVVTGGRDGDVVRFERAETDDIWLRFINPDHNFPQVIQYATIEGVLVAEISTLTGDGVRRFEKKPCP
ncbi:MAG: DUF6265 family protein [Pseudomonadota bacterium]